MFDFLKTRRRRNAARQEARDLLAALSAAGTAEEAERAAQALRGLGTSGAIPDAEMHRSYVVAYVVYADASIRDDQLSEPEAQVLSGIRRDIGELRQEDVEGGELVSATNRVQACLINTVGPAAVSSALGGHDATVYWEGPVQLLRQKRTFRGHGPSISVPIGKGVRFRWSMFEGAPAYSADYVIVDNGTLAVTSEELVFLGAHNTITTKLEDVLQVDLLSDGIRVHSSRRERVDAFSTPAAPVAAATIQWLLAHDDNATRQTHL